MSEATFVDIVQPMQNEEIIELNVGGTIYTTLKSTLTAVGGVFPHMMEHPENWPKDNQGRIFLDRNPNRFRILLDWLRNKDRTFKYRITTDMKDELEYFGLFAGLLYEKMTGSLIHVWGHRLLPIERITLLTVKVGGVEYKHTQYDGCMLRPS